MYDRKIKGKKEFVFDNKKEFRSYFPLEPLELDWKTAP